MGHSKTSATRIRAAVRRAEVLALRLGGKSFHQIGEQLGVSRQRAYRLTADALAEMNERYADSAGEALRLELERLNCLQAAVWDKAMAGDLRAVDSALKIQDRRSRLLGLYAPDKHELALARGEPVKLTIEDIMQARRDVEEWHANVKRELVEGEAQHGGSEAHLPATAPG